MKSNHHRTAGGEKKGEDRRGNRNQFRGAANYGSVWPLDRLGQEGSIEIIDKAAIKPSESKGTKNGKYKEEIRRESIALKFSHICS